MKTKHGGFTLVELIVVVLIMGILASMGVPYYYKTIETSKATDSISLGHLLANAHRMFNLDNPAVAIEGQVSNSCNSGACSPTDTSACRLVRCNYVAKQDWDSSAYDYFICAGGSGGCCVAGSVSCTRRKSGASADYSGWGYIFSDSGGCTPTSTAPDCPKF